MNDYDVVDEVDEAKDDPGPWPAHSQPARWYYEIYMRTDDQLWVPLTDHRIKCRSLRDASRSSVKGAAYGACYAFAREYGMPTECWLWVAGQKGLFMWRFDQWACEVTQGTCVSGEAV